MRQLYVIDSFITALCLIEQACTEGTMPLRANLYVAVLFAAAAVGRVICSVTLCPHCVLSLTLLSRTCITVCAECVLTMSSMCPQLGAHQDDEHGEEDDDDMGVVETYADYMPAKRETQKLQAPRASGPPDFARTRAVSVRLRNVARLGRDAQLVGRMWSYGPWVLRL